MAKETQFVEQIADIEKDFPQWYTDVVIKTKLVDYGPVQGTDGHSPLRLRHLGKYSEGAGRPLQKGGGGERLFPLLLPMSFFTKEAEHVEGFAPEVAVVTVAGGEKLAEPLAIRPTSETDHRHDVLQMDSVLSRFAAENQSVVQRHALGKDHPVPSCAPANFSGRKGIPSIRPPRRRRRAR